MFIINVNNNSKAIGSLIDDINSSGKIKITVLVRKENTYILPKRMIVNAGDRLLFICDKNALSKIVNLFKDKPKYLL